MNKSKSGPKVSATVKAVELLSRSDQSVRRLSEKLARRQYSPEEIQETMAWLQEKHYVDDEAGCQRRFEYLFQSSSNSVKQICAKLIQQGYDSGLVRSCVPEDIYEREREKAAKVLARKYKEPVPFQKMMQYLYSKGFLYEAARDAAEDFLAEHENE